MKSRHSKSVKGFKNQAPGMMDNESLRQFNYYGQTRLENLDEHDVVGLEREIDFIIRNSYLGSNSPVRGATAGVPVEDYQLPQKRNKTAGHGGRKRMQKKTKS